MANGISQDLWNQLSPANQQAYLASGANSIYEFSPAAAGLMLIGGNINDIFTSALSVNNAGFSENGIGGIQNFRPGSSPSGSTIQSSLALGSFAIQPNGEIKYVQNSSVVAGPVLASTGTPGSSVGSGTSSGGSTIPSIFDNIPKITVALTGIAAIDKLIPKLNIGPSLLDSIKSVKDGSIFKTVSSSMDDMANSVSGLGSGAVGLVNNLKATSLQSISNLTKDFGKYLALAQTSMDLKAKAIISAGGIPTEADLISASGPLKSLAESASSIKDTISNVQSQISSIQSQLGMSFDEFKKLIPLPGTVEYDQFITDNADKMALIQSAEDKLTELTSGVNGILSSATSGLQDSIKGLVGDLKAGALVSQIAQSGNSVINRIKSKVIDETKISASNIEKTMYTAASSINVALPIPKLKPGIAPAEKNPLEPTPIPNNNRVDRVFDDEEQEYYAYVKTLISKKAEAEKIMEGTSAYATYKPVADSYVKLKAAKPDTSTWSDSELAVLNNFNTLRANVKATSEYKAYDAALTLMREEVENWGAVNKAVLEKSSRSVLSAEIRSRLIHESEYTAASQYKV